MERLGEYVLVQELSRGSQGVVYEARRTNHDHAVALKVLLDTDPVARARFEREARLLASLRHPHVPGVVALETSHDRPHVALELIPGRDLSERLREGPLAADEAATLLKPIAAALAHCHARGVVHRDVKPANIRVGVDDHPVLVDFGLARPDGAEARQRLTTTGEILGTPSTMAPEQLDPSFGAVGPAADVYGLGATAYWLLAGEPPFRAPSVVNLAASILTEPAPDVRRLAPATPPALAELISACLAKRPEQRPDADAVAEALAAPVRPPPTGTPPHLIPVALLALVLVVALGAAAIATRSEPNPPPQAPPPPAPDPYSTGPQVDAVKLWKSSGERMKRGEWSAAERDLEAALQLDAHRITYYLRLGMVRRRLKKYPEALAAYEQGLARRPAPVSAARFHLYRGVALEEMGRLAQASDAYGRAAKLDPELTGARYRLGALYLKQRRYAEAERAFTSCIDIDEDRYPNLFQLRGNARQGLRRDQDAALDYERQLQKDPASKHASANRAFIREHLGRDPVERADRVDPPDRAD